MKRGLWWLWVQLILLVVFEGVGLPISLGQLPSLGVPAVTHFTTNDYRAGTQNWSIRQDAKGIVYVGNNKGLLEFDGNTWSLFQLPNHTIVRSLVVSNSGRLYLGSQDDFGYLNSGESSQIGYQSLVENSLIPSGALKMSGKFSRLKVVFFSVHKKRYFSTRMRKSRY
jgi:hypothetical protein